MFSKTKNDQPVPIELAAMLEEVSRRHKKREAIRFENRVVTYQELDEEANRVAGGLASLGIGKGDRGAIICLSNFSNLIQEIQSECPELKHVIITGQRTFVFVEPEGSVNVQLVFEKTLFADTDTAFHTIGAAMMESFKQLGVGDAWYSHIGAIRASGKKLATILLSEIENLYICNIMTWLKNMDTAPLFKVLYVPPEIKERALEPMTSVLQETGRKVSLDDFKALLAATMADKLGVSFSEGELTRYELIACEKNRALAGRLV